MKRLLALLLCALAAPLPAAEPAPAPEPYQLTVAGQAYAVLSADAADGYRVSTPDGRVIGIPAADPTAALTAEALATALATPPAPPAPVPAEIGSGQIRAAMIATGIAADVDALDALILSALQEHVADATQRAVAVALWRHATAFKREHSTIALVAAAIGRTPEQIDDLFRLAATF